MYIDNEQDRHKKSIFGLEIYRNIKVICIYIYYFWKQQVIYYFHIFIFCGKLIMKLNSS